MVKYKIFLKIFKIDFYFVQYANGITGDGRKNNNNNNHNNILLEHEAPLQMEKL